MFLDTMNYCAFVTRCTNIFYIPPVYHHTGDLEVCIEKEIFHVIKYIAHEHKFVHTSQLHITQMWC